ncbi:quinone oxidoreductase family protein [Streptomyces sp. NPDC001276]|uniref:quinone oxidoreductase family protein n=1 Tax=Streptomyces sp. NPDC001276 TaxID=3364555 RepID=UPI0036B64DD0
MKAVVVEQFGGPEAMQLADRPEPVAGPGEVVVDVEFAGINFMDTGMRTNSMGNFQAPLVPGAEGAGRVRSLGPGVTEFSEGDRVAWAFVFGSYAERIVAATDTLVPVPEDISSDITAAVMMQGLTAHHFTQEVAPLPAGTTALVHAAAGGVGQLVVQMLKERGVRVIGLVSRPEKKQAATDAGADHVLVTRDGDFVQDVLDLTDAHGVDAVFDNSDEHVFPATLKVLARSATVCWYGPLMGTGPVLPLAAIPRSARISYGVFMDHIATREHLLAHSNDLFNRIRTGTLSITIPQRYALADAAQAHRDIESRATTGKLLIDMSL